jgi:hypothetical protein
MNELLPKPIKHLNFEMGVSFDPIPHKYSDKYGTDYTSVSSYVKSFFPFPKDIKVDPQKSKIACDWGTYIHKKCEDYILSGGEVASNFEVYANLYNFLESELHNIIGSEVMLFNPALSLCGTADLLLNRDGRIIIGDFKTNKSLGYNNGLCPHPLTKEDRIIQNTTLNGYFFQMSIYAYLLKSTYGIVAESVEIWHIQPETYEIKVYESPVLWDWVEDTLPYFSLRDIHIDTREQLPLPFDIPNKNIKMDEGDYTTDYLSDKFVIDRKSPSDFYGSLIQDHERFRAEIIRAQSKGKEIEIWVECPKKVFIGKSWGGKSYSLKTEPKVLAKIVKTFSERYLIHFEWCENRTDMRDKMLDKFVERTRHYKSLEVTK